MQLSPHDITPKPGPLHIKHAGHHWLDNYDFEGRYHGTYVFQWAPGAQQWFHSGEVGTCSHPLNLKGWVYNSPAEPPPIRDGMFNRPDVDENGHIKGAST